MNCDEAFDQITDPARNRSAELEWHLDLCPRCRQMREVLAPALDLLMPVDSDPAGDEASGFASYHSVGESEREVFLSPESLAVAERAAESFARQRRPARPRSRSQNRWLKYATVFALAGVLTLGGYFLAGEEKRRRAAAMPAADSCLLMQQPVSVDSLRQAGAGNVIQQCQVCHADAVRKNQEVD